jgi:hypothetical protein
MSSRSRWWWWIAGVPLSVGFWAMTVLWLAIATAGTGLLDRPLVSAAALATVMLGLPLLVIAFVFPIAVVYDARVLLDRGALTLDPHRLGVTAAVSLLTGPVLSVPYACWYLWRRHRAVGIP